MNAVRKFFIVHKTLLLSLGFLFLFSFTVVKATPPASPYTAGITLDPSCTPGSTNCTVSVSTPSLWDTVTGGINYAGGNVGIGITTPSVPLEVNGEAKVGNLMVTGTSLGSVGNPTNLQASAVYDPALYSYNSSNNDFLNYRVYAYKIINSNRVYSPSYTTLSSDFSDNSGNTYGVSLTWDAVPGADGYRILVNYDGEGFNPGAGWSYDTTNASFIDDSCNVTCSSDMTVIPNLAYSNSNVINGTTALNGTVSIGSGSIYDDSTGRLGLGTTTPAASLDIEGDGSILAVGAYGSGGSVPNLGSGTRLMWIPSTGVFRAGNAYGTQWDASNDGLYSAAFGNNTTASGDYSFAAGGNTTASGYYSSAFGGSVASGNYSSAFSGSTASGLNATAFGLATTASGQAATSLGYITNAYGDNSFSAGSDSAASGAVSAAFGFNTLADSEFSMVFGSYNIGGGSSNSWVDTDPLFEIGNANPQFGPPSARSDAIIILKNGSTGIALDPSSPSPSYTLQVGSGAVATGIVARFQNVDGTCDINPTTASLACSSDMTLKKNITDLADNTPWSFNTNIAPASQSVLDDILSLTPVTYNWNSESDTTPKHPGFIAQDVQQVFPTLVSQDPKTGLLSLNYTGLIPYTIEALKELNLKLVSIDDLTKQNSWRDALTAWFADAGNGIGDFVAGRLCVKDDQGQTCITRAQLDQLLQNNSGQSSGGGTTASSDSQTNTQTPEVTTPAIDTQTPDVVTPTVDVQTPDVTTPTIDTQTPDTAAPIIDTPTPPLSTN